MNAVAVRDVDAWLTTEFLLLLPERPNIACELFPDSRVFPLGLLNYWARISAAICLERMLFKVVKCLGCVGLEII